MEVISSVPILEIIKKIIDFEKTREVDDTNSDYYRCFRLHLTHVFGIYVDSSMIPTDNSYIGDIELRGKEYSVCFDKSVLWFTIRPRA